MVTKTVWSKWPPGMKPSFGARAGSAQEARRHLGSSPSRPSQPVCPEGCFTPSPGPSVMGTLGTGPWQGWDGGGAAWVELADPVKAATGPLGRTETLFSSHPDTDDIHLADFYFSGKTRTILPSFGKDPLTTWQTSVSNKYTSPSGMGLVEEPCPPGPTPPPHLTGGPRAPQGPGWGAGVQWPPCTF